MSYFVVGDIHGCAKQLQVLLSDRELYRNRQIVLLGDYIDVGPDSKGVLDILVELYAHHAQMVALEGNHEAALKSFLNGGDFASYAQVGGIATLNAYCGEIYGNVISALDRAIPSSHMQFLESLEIFVETSEYLFSHAGYSPGTPFDRGRDAMVLRSHQDLFTGQPTLSKTCVCGHYFQQTRRPHISEGVICLDTGCGILNGPLTAALLPERQLIQVSTDLRVERHDFQEDISGDPLRPPHRLDA
jgi:serine/threonine protein phosphatase 1